MKPVSPHHLLSAYLDGEVSPGERDEVERLLSESPEARQELGELAQIRELLRQLPRESLPNTFVSRILNECQDTLQEPAADGIKKTAAVRSGDSLGGKRSGWLRLAGLAISAAAAVVIVWFSFSETAKDRPGELAQRSPNRRANTESEVGERTERSQPMAAGNTEAAGARNEAPLAETQPPPLAKTKEQETEAPGVGIAASSLPKAFLGADRKSQLVFGRDLKDVPIGQVVEALDRQGDKVAVVKLTVVDRQRGLKDLQVLLKKHQIVSADAAAPTPKESPANNAAPSQNAPLLAVYVETSDNQLAAAMRELQKEAAFRQLTIDAPITVAGLDPLMTSPQSLEAQRRNRVRPFSAAGADVPGLQSLNPAQIKMKAARTPKPEPSADEASPPKPMRFKAEAQPAPADQSKPDAVERKPAGKSSAPRLAKPSNGKSETPVTEKKDEAKIGAFQRGFGGGGGNFNQTSPSSQRQLTLPANVLDELQKKRSGTETKQAEADKKPAPEQKTAKRVHILFVLVDEAGKTESQPASPAKKPAPPADNNGAA